MANCERIKKGKEKNCKINLKSKESHSLCKEEKENSGRGRE
jgi:hypothetical protein